MKAKLFLMFFILIVITLSSCKRRAFANLVDSCNTAISVVGVPMEVYSGDTVYVILETTPGLFEKGGTNSQYVYVPESIEARTSRAIIK